MKCKLWISVKFVRQHLASVSINHMNTCVEIFIHDKTAHKWLINDYIFENLIKVDNQRGLQID
jgi:hypothetical protein